MDVDAVVNAAIEFLVGGGGVDDYPLNETCTIAIDTCKKYQDKLDIYLVCFSDNEVDTFRKIIKKVRNFRFFL